MGRVFKGEVSTAIRMLRRNRGRSLLTLLGIIVGVTSVVSVIAIGQGVAEQVTQQTERLGSDLITIRPGQLTPATGLLGGIGQLGGTSYLATFTPHDLAVISSTPGVKAVVPLSAMTATITTDQSKTSYQLPIIGTTQDFPSMLGQQLAYGSFLTGETTDVNKVILGADAATALFTQNVPLGQTVNFLGQDFIVVGILKESQTPALTLNVDFNDAIFMSNDAAQALTNNNARLFEMFARPTSPAQTDVVIDRLRSALLLAHGGQADFSVLKQSQTVAATTAILNLLTDWIIGVAVIALLVGGVGIMNVMLVSVTERMHEIGVRKAVGATNRQILWQFVIEATVLSVAGAGIGIILAILAMVGVGLTTNLTPVLTWQSIASVCLLSIVVGVLFGSVPALKAAKKDPISALRNR